MSLRLAVIAICAGSVPRLHAQATPDTGVVRVTGTYYVEVTMLPRTHIAHRPLHWGMNFVFMADSATLAHMRLDHEYSPSPRSTPACWISALPGWMIGYGSWDRDRADTIRVVPMRQFDVLDEFMLAISGDSVSGVELYSADYPASGAPVATIRGHRVGPADRKNCTKIPTPPQAQGTG